jgi:hypothetical protein
MWDTDDIKGVGLVNRLTERCPGIEDHIIEDIIDMGEWDYEELFKPWYAITEDNFDGVHTWGAHNKEKLAELLLEPIEEGQEVLGVYYDCSPVRHKVEVVIEE